MRVDSHLMELPNRILIGSNVIGRLESFIEDRTDRKVVVAAGATVASKIRDKVDTALGRRGIWYQVTAADLTNVEGVQACSKGAACIVGLGGGKSVDVGKLAAYNLRLPFFSVPTSAAHDGISSPFASIKGLNRPYSMVAKPPVGILADIDVIASAPRRLLAAGCGDLVSKVTAVRDWQLAHRVKGEYYGSYAASLALMSADVVLKHSSRIADYSKESVRDLVEALISTGVAAGIAGSSRPCSGSEHLFSHALDAISPESGLHGEKCGLGTIMMAKLHHLDWQKVREALRRVGAPIEASAIGLSSDQVVRALVKAGSIRPDRYTILAGEHLTTQSALRLARSTGVV